MQGFWGEKRCFQPYFAVLRGSQPKTKIWKFQRVKTGPAWGLCPSSVFYNAGYPSACGNAGAVWCCGVLNGGCESLWNGGANTLQTIPNLPSEKWAVFEGVDFRYFCRLNGCSAECCSAICDNSGRHIVIKSARVRENLWKNPSGITAEGVGWESMKIKVFAVFHRVWSI